MSTKPLPNVPYLDAVRPDFGWHTEFAVLATYSADLVVLTAALFALALGQPNQEDLLEILSSKAGMDSRSVRQAVINLSPWFRNAAAKDTP